VGTIRCGPTASGAGHSADTIGGGGGGVGSRGSGSDKTVRCEVKKKNSKYRVNCVARGEREVRASV
jgi:hypothetical protein